MTSSSGGLVLGALLPLQERRLAAQSAHQDAQALEVWLGARIDEKQALTGGNQGAAPQVPETPIGTSGLEQGLIAARLRRDLSALATQPDGAVDLRFDRVDFMALARWMSGAHPEWGYAIDSFRMEALEGRENTGYISAWITLVPAGG